MRIDIKLIGWFWWAIWLLASMAYFFSEAIAQNNTQQPLQLGISAAAFSYQGDLVAPGEAFHRVSAGAGLSLQFDSQRRIQPQLSAGFGKFVAQYRDLPPLNGLQPNRFVTTNFFYARLILKAKFIRQGPIRPYVGVGIGLLIFNPRDINGNKLAQNTVSRAPGESYSNLTAIFPLNPGCMFRLSDFISLGIDYYYMPTGSPYLDNVGKLGPNNGKSDKLHQLSFTMYITPSKSSTDIFGN